MGRNRILACRFAHGAGRTRFSRVRGTPRERANILNFLARIFGSEGISAHFGPVAESDKQKNPICTLDSRRKTRCASWSNLCTTLYHYIHLTSNLSQKTVSGAYCAYRLHYSEAGDTPDPVSPAAGPFRLRRAISVISGDLGDLGDLCDLGDVKSQPKNGCGCLLCVPSPL